MDSESSIEVVHDDFEIVDVNDTNDKETTEPNEEVEQEFDFPLFSFGTVTEDSSDQPQLMKVSLNEEHEEIIQERPKDYYFQRINELERQNIKLCAVTYEDVLKDSLRGPNEGWKKFRGKVIDLNEYNRLIDRDNEIKLKHKKRRPGKKQRLARKMGSKRVDERKAKEVELKKMRKKMFHKRGGKKNKKKADNSDLQPIKPKFRTE